MFAVCFWILILLAFVAAAAYLCPFALLAGLVAGLLLYSFKKIGMLGDS